MTDKMGSARKLCTKKREVKLHTAPSVKTETVITSRGERGVILGPFLAFRHPLRCFSYNKTRRRAPGYRASQGHWNHYTWNWRKYLLKTREMPLALFSIKGTKVSESPAENKEKAEKLRLGTFEPKEQKKFPAKREKRIDFKTVIEEHKALPERSKRVEAPVIAKIEAKPVIPAPKINVKTDIKVEGIKTVKVVENGRKYVPKPAVVKAAEIQNKNGSADTPVSKSEQEGMNFLFSFRKAETTIAPELMPSAS